MVHGSGDRCYCVVLQWDSVPSLEAGTCAWLYGDTDGVGLCSSGVFTWSECYKET